jgi:hypothetical protein
MPWSFDEAPKYVINLDRRRDRWTTFQSSTGFEQLNNLRFTSTDYINQTKQIMNNIKPYYT